MNFTLAVIVMFALDRPVIGVGEVFRPRAGVWRTPPPAPRFPRMWWELMEGVGWLQVSSGGTQTPEGTPHLPGGARPDPARTCLCFLTSRSFQQARVIAIVQSGLTEELE